MSSLKRSASPAFSPPSKRFGSPSTPISPALASTSASRFAWLDRIGKNETLLHAKYGDPRPSSKVAWFDFVGTLVEPISINKYCQSATDWKWLERKQPKGSEGREEPDELPDVVVKVRELYDNGYSIVIYSSTTLDEEYFDDFQEIVQAACTELDVPLHAFFSTGYDVYRSPCVGVWLEYEREWNGGQAVNLKKSLLVSHASGVGRLDYARKFASNVALPFHIPGAFFHGEDVDAPWSLQGWNPKKFAHSEWLYMPTSTPLIPRQRSEFDDPIADVVLFVGPPASGKTSFYYRHFEKHGYERITSNDVDHLESKLRSTPAQHRYVLDFSLASRASRAPFVRLVKLLSAPPALTSPATAAPSLTREPRPRCVVRCLEFVVSEEVCKHNSQFAELWDHSAGGRGYDTPEGRSREFTPEEEFTEWRMSVQAPKVSEGFDEMKQVRFKFDEAWPTREQGKARLKLWGKYGDCYKKDWMTRK
ncbi:hypothetical protein JCM11491_002585 [Sporobolomyces phaffii]